MNDSRNGVSVALRAVESQLDEFQKILVDLARIPSVSAEGFPPLEVRRSADIAESDSGSSRSRSRHRPPEGEQGTEDGRGAD